MKRKIILPVGQIEVEHDGNETVLRIGMTGDLIVFLRLDGYAAGRLADALEDVNTNRVTPEEALAVTATTETETVWGVWEHFGGETEGPDLKSSWHSEANALAERDRLNRAADLHAPGHVSYSVQPVRQPKGKG